MQVRLTRKLAQVIDGVDLSRRRVGDLLDLPQHDADLLLAEGWATLADSACDGAARPNVRADRAWAPRQRTATVDQLRHVQEQMDERRFEQREHRRAEDRIREELQDSRAKTLGPHQHS